MLDKIEIAAKMAEIAHMPLSVYTHDQKLVKSYKDNENILTIDEISPKKIQKCLDRSEEYPFDFQRIEGEIWVGIINFEAYIVFVGPLMAVNEVQDVQTSNPSRYVTWEYLKQYDAFIPQIESDEGHRVFRIIYETLTDKSFCFQDIWNQDEELVRKSRCVKKKTDDFLFNQWETQRKHHSYAQEQRLLEQISTGDLEGLRRVRKESLGGDYGVLAKDKLRSYKNLGVSMITLYTRAAAAGGLNYELALTLSDAYICQMEEATKWEEVIQIANIAAEDFTIRVNGYKSANQIHLLVEKCQDIIFSRLHSKISVQELAGELKVNPDYLSRLFHECMGMTIVEFIQEEKVKLAKNMLVYSTYSLEEIAYYLGFASQSHFGKVFKQITKMSPGYYRKTYKVPEFYEEPESVTFPEEIE